MSMNENVYIYIYNIYLHIYMAYMQVDYLYTLKKMDDFIPFNLSHLRWDFSFSNLPL